MKLINIMKEMPIIMNIPMKRIIIVIVVAITMIIWQGPGPAWSP